MCSEGSQSPQICGSCHSGTGVLRRGLPHSPPPFLSSHLSPRDHSFLSAFHRLLGRGWEGLCVISSCPCDNPPNPSSFFPGALSPSPFLFPSALPTPQQWSLPMLSGAGGVGEAGPGAWGGGAGLHCRFPGYPEQSPLPPAPRPGPQPPPGTHLTPGTQPRSPEVPRKEVGSLFCVILAPQLSTPKLAPPPFPIPLLPLSLPYAPN